MTQKANATTLEVQDDPVESARAAGLRYVSDTAPGISRKGAGKGFTYTGPDGKKISDTETLARIQALAIPPAWTDVWICPNERGHIQATGRDDKGRKQYRYHARWHEVRDETKYSRVMAFGRALPGIRARVRKDLALQGLPREKVLATVVRLLETTLIRVGNEEYAKENKSYGLTTLRDRHVEIDGSEVRFQFRGKSGRTHSISLKDRRLAGIVKRLQDLPGQDLFEYVDDDGERQAVTSADVNDYLREVSGEDFTAKDFRTWAGTVLASRALHEMESVDSEAGAKKNIVQAIEHVAERLGNTPTVCRKCYVHPAVLESYVDGTLLDMVKEKARKELAGDLGKLPPEEAAVLVLLEKRLESELRGTGSG
jgi:DNA topoisomerase I